MALSDLAVFQEYAYDAMTEVLDQQVDKFNQASNGTVSLVSAANQGDYSERAMFKKIGGLVRRRNAYGSGAVAAKSLEHLLKASVKVAAGTPPVEIDPGQFKWIQQNPEIAGATIGQQLAGDTLADMLNTGLMAGSAAMETNSEVVNDVSGSSKASLGALNATAAKFGDRAQDILAWIGHSKVIFDIYGEALNNSNRLFSFGTVNVREDGFGRPIIITDSGSLYVSGSPDKYKTLGLTAGGILVEQNGDFTDNVETSNGDENIARTYQAEWSYNLGVKGHTWDTANGGKSPNDTALGTGTNWDKVSSSNKDTAGVLLISQ